MNEAFLQYIWQHRLTEGPLATTDGRSVLVNRTGTLNSDAGPDFFDARLVVDGIEWVGNIEIHVKASDWRLHGHSSDPSYDNVILHVVYEANEQIETSDGRAIPTLSLKGHIPEILWNNYDALVNPPAPIDVPCAGGLLLLPQFRIDSYLDRLLIERIERKIGDVRRLLDDAHGGWEQCCYWLIGRYFGGKTNAFPFELLTKATDMRLLARWKDNPQRVEALLFGQAGMLDEYFDDDYPRQLQADYHALRSGSGLMPISKHLWKYFRLRPSSFPTLRISQFAALISRSSSLFSKLLEMTDVRQIEEVFDVKASPYWDEHYHFDKPASLRVKAVGIDFVHNIIINAWVPLLFYYGVAHSDEMLKERAIALMHQLPAEENAIVRKWQAVGVKVQDAATSQSVIQLYNEYCQERQCLRCQFGVQVIKNSTIL